MRAKKVERVGTGGVGTWEGRRTGMAGWGSRGGFGEFGGSRPDQTLNASSNAPQLVRRNRI